MSNTPEKLPITSQLPLEERLEALKTLIPEAFSEGKIDFSKLRSALGDAVDSSNERYGLSWAGKSEAIRAVQIPSRGTLEPMPDKSVNFDSSQNLIIEGDNLEVLKLLQKSYYGKIKMIYIDPPYNTGNEFIYPDNFREGLHDYLTYSGQRSNGGEKYTSSEEIAGRKHSRWLNMMYPRLFLARNLLKDDGVIFVSIDDNEVKNLRMLMDEVFGEDCFVISFVWKRRTGSNDSKTFYASTDHEYIIAYARTPNFSFSGLEKDLGNYTNPDSDPKGPWAKDNLTCNKTSQERPNLYYPITDPKTGIIYQCNPNRVWAYEPKKMAKLIEENKVIFPTSGKGTPVYKRHLSELRSSSKPLSSWVVTSSDNGDENESLNMEFPLNMVATKQLRDLLDGQYFDFPKSWQMLYELISQATSSQGNDIILDFFAGSGTVAQSVLELNRNDVGNRRFILVQLPEKTQFEDYPTITDITLERTRRVIKKLNDADNGSLGLHGTPDRGFKAFTLRASNFKQWDGEAIAKSPERLEEQLTFFAHNLEPSEADEQGILFEILLKSGLTLTAQVTALELTQKVYAVEDKTLYICLAQPIEEATLKAVIAAKPQRFICLDAAFEGNDQLKTNTLLQMRNAGITFYTV